MFTSMYIKKRASTPLFIYWLNADTFCLLSQISCNNNFRLFLLTSKTSSFRGLVQDGRVEGHALTPSCESTGITTNCWTIIDKKTLELTKKDTPHPKTKEKPQWDGRRGAITVKSNPITAGWVIHKLANTYTTEVHPLEWSFWAPCQASQPGVQQQEEEFLENQTLRLAGFDCRTSTGLGKTETPLLEGTHKVAYASGHRGRSSDPMRDWTRPTC